jgi:glycine/serine hydroxymethyltransferase
LRNHTSWHCITTPQTILDEVSITLNKNSVPGDKSAIVPGGIRIGTPALTTRGFKEEDFIKVADFIHRAIQVRQRLAGADGKTEQDNPTLPKQLLKPSTASELLLQLGRWLLRHGNVRNCQ